METTNTKKELERQNEIRTFGGAGLSEFKHDKDGCRAMEKNKLG